MNNEVSDDMQGGIEQKRNYRIIVELFAHKEKLLKEFVHMESGQNPIETLSLAFQARVLGKGKGTPFLKSGIRCIGIEMDEDESEASDWQGFEKDE